MTRNILIVPCRICTLAYVLSLQNFTCLLLTVVGRDSVVGVTTRYGLYGPGSNPDWGEIFRTLPDRPWSPY
jgi:hypothetical protein